MGVAEELDISLQVKSNIALHPGAKSPDKLRVVERDHVIKVVLMPVFDIDTPGDEEAFIKDVILGMGFVDPLDCDVGVVKEVGT